MMNESAGYGLNGVVDNGKIRWLWDNGGLCIWL